MIVEVRSYRIKPGRREEFILSKVGRAAPESVAVLRGLRAIEVLEAIGTAEARTILQELAKGTPGAKLTREAAAALARLDAAAQTKSGRKN